MRMASKRTERLHELLDLALAYRGWSKTQLAQAINRSPGRVYTETDNPTLDLLVGISDVLDWSGHQVMNFIWSGIRPPIGCAEDVDVKGLSFDEVGELAAKAHRAGEYVKSLQYARKLHALAKTPTQRAEACNKESFGWDGLGRYTKALNAAKAGLREKAIPTDLRMVLRVNLAGFHYALTELDIARAMAQSLLNWFEHQPPKTLRHRDTQAFAYYISGSVSRCLIEHDAENAEFHARNCKRELETAAKLYLPLAEEFSRPDLSGVANTCKAGLIEAEVELGLRDPESAVAELQDGLPGPVSEDGAPKGDWLESYGWWCVCGASIALRHLTGSALQRPMAAFTEKILEIADEMDNWAFRECALRMEYDLRQFVTDATGYEQQYTLDETDVRSLVGTMGRFPGFVELGWEILGRGKVVNHDKRN